MSEFKIPELGENIDSGEVVAITVAIGDSVAVDQTLFELETDKAVIEVPSPVAGTVNAINIAIGDKVSVGQAVMDIGAASGPKAVVQEVPAPVVAPVQDLPVAVAPAPVLTPAPAPAISSAPVVAAVQPAATSAALNLNNTVSQAHASPSVRRLAREIGVDIEKVKGTGIKGRITLDDVKTHARELNTKLKNQPQGGAISGPVMDLPDFSKWGSIERKPMSSVRRKTAQHLSQAWFIPHVTQFDKADITELERLRKTFGKRAEKAGGKLTLTVIVLKVLASALKVFPQFNASVDMATDEVIYKNYFNIGVAVDTDRGLLVPVVRDVEKKNIIELSADLNRIAEASRDRKLKLEDMQGGCFTVSNLGGLGGTYFTPIVNAPEVAILGLSRGRMEPVYVDGEFEPRMMLPLSLSYDHRVIDGADAIRFLRWVAEALEQPFLMDLEG